VGLGGAGHRRCWSVFNHRRCGPRFASIGAGVVTGVVTGVTSAIAATASATAAAAPTSALALWRILSGGSFHGARGQGRELTFFVLICPKP
jgi:hypothetical protein